MNLLVAVDFSGATVRQLDAVRRLAAAAGAVHLVHVVEPDPDFIGFEAGPDVVRDQVAAEFRDAHERVQTLAEGLRSDGFDATALLIQGPTVEMIVRTADKVGAEAIVVGSHGHGALFDLVVGSVSAGVMRAAKVPVLVVPAR
jgi:nucleotide-binding universal stress UspA family protein